MPETEIPKTGPEAILHALSQMNADSIEAEAKAALATGKKTHRNKAVQKLRIVEGLRRNQLEPKDYMITKVPVIPTRFRPFAAQGDTLIPGDANILYKDLLDVKAAHDEERKMFGEKNAGTSRLALYDAVKASYGYGDPVKPKTKEKDVQGFLKVIVGRTAKRGFVQSKLMSKTQDNVGRSTIIVDPELSMDEIGIPKAMAFTMYAPYIQRHLKQAGYRDAEALKHVKDQTPEALAALERIVRERPVLYSRAPAWHKFSVNAGNVKLVDDDAISISPAVTSGLGADFDGDNVIGCILVSYDKSELLSKFGINFLGKNVLTDEHVRDTIRGMYKNTTIPHKVDEKHVICLSDMEDILHGELSNTVTGKNGVIHFYQAIPGTEVLAYDPLTGEVAWKPVSFWSEHPDRKVEIVTLSNGRQLFTDDDPRAIYGIPNDSVSMIPERFTPSEALRRKVVVPVVNSIEEPAGTLRKIKMPYSKDADKELNLTFNCGQFLGIMCGDGWVDKKDYRRGKGARYIHLSDNSGYNAAFCKTYLTEEYGATSLFTTSHEFKREKYEGRYGDSVRYTFSFDGGVEFSKTIHDWIGGERDEHTSGSANKHLPPFFLSANKDFREGLLCGVIATDGTCSVSNAKNSPQLMIEFSSTSLRLIREVRLLCLSLGIKATVSFSRHTSGDNDSWILTLSSIDAKRNGCLSKLAHQKKRHTFITTAVSDSPEHVKFDSVPFTEHIKSLIRPYLYAPKKPSTPYETESLNLYGSFVGSSVTLSKFNATRVCTWLLDTLSIKNDIKERAMAYLRTEDETCDESTLIVIRKALLNTVHSILIPDMYKDAQKLYDRTKRSRNTKRMSKATKTVILEWLETHEPIEQMLLDNPDFATWKRLFVDQSHISWVPIESVEKTGKVETGYDLTVPGYETFMNSEGVILSNTINVHVPASDDAVKEAYEKLMPSKHAFSDRDSSKVVPLPKQEQILGLYTAATAPATKPVVFDTEEDAIRAIRQGKISLSTDVEIRGQQKYAAADKKEEDLVEGIRKPGDEKGPVRVPKTGRFMKTVREHDDVRNAVNKAMKEKGKDLRADEYAEEYAREYAREVARRSNK